MNKQTRVHLLAFWHAVTLDLRVLRSYRVFGTAIRQVNEGKHRVRQSRV